MSLPLLQIGRFAPSPTGAQHLGNARTYLATHWSALKQNSHMVLRIEDIDSPRVKPWAMSQAIDDLRWLGIRWHEGPDVGGPNGPYLQTKRGEQYDQAVAQLRKENRIYPCTCTRKDILNAASAPHADESRVVYPGTCSSWNEGDPIPLAGSYCWRFRVSNAEMEFDDFIAGRQSMNPAAVIGDFPLIRKSGGAAYQLAVVVDDAAMKVSEVIRGDDLIESTFWQIDLYRALGLAIPRFGHLPLVIGSDGNRLAKRHGDTRLSHLRNHGLECEDVIIWAARSLGIDCDFVNGECLTDLHARIAAQLDWAKVPPDPVTAPIDWTSL